MLGNGSLNITGQHTDLSKGTTSAQRISITTTDLSNAAGQLAATGTDALHLQVGNRLDNSGGSIGSNGAVELSASQFINNQGKLVAAGDGASTLKVGQLLDNTGGVLSSNGDLSVNAGQLNNAGGTVLTADEASLQLTVDGLLDNSSGGRVAAGGDLSVAADVLDNRTGTIEHAGEGTLDIAVNALHGAGGKIIGNGDLKLQGETLDLQGATTQAKRLQVTAGSLTTADGVLVSTGGDALQLKVRDLLNNDRGTIAANGALALEAGHLSNRGGTLSAAGSGDSVLQVDGELDNSDGTIASNAESLTLTSGSLVNEEGTVSHAGEGALVLQTGKLDGQRGTITSAGALQLTAGQVDHRDATLNAKQLTVNAAGFDNRGGTVLGTGQQLNSITVQGTLDNGNGGTIASNGDLSLKAATFGNAGGTVQHAGTGTLSIDATTLNGQGGTLLGNGALSITGQHTDLGNGTTSAQRISITTTDLNNAGGQLSATGSEALRLQVANRLDNSGGSIGSNGSFDVSAAAFINNKGNLQAAGSASNRLDVAGALDNRGGNILAAGDTRIDAGSVDNRGGTLHAAGDSQLVLAVDGLLDNSDKGTVSSGGDASINADTLNNAGGSIATGDALTVTTGNAIDNTAGLIQGGSSLQLASNGLLNSGGTLLGNSVSIDTRGHALDNRDGTLASLAGALDIRSGALDNSAGLIQSAAALSIDTAGQQLSNLNSGSAGGIVSAGTLDISSGSLDNRAGVVFAQGEAQVHAGAVDNTSGGSLVSAGGLLVQAQELANSGGEVKSGADATINLQGALDNNAGLIASSGSLQVTAATVDNRNTASTPTLGLQARNLQLTAHSLDNRQGQLIADNDARLQLTGQLNNSGGQVSTGNNLEMRADAVLNTGGTLVSGGNLQLDARHLSGDGKVWSQGDATLNLVEGFTNTDEVAANGKLTLNTQGALDNQGKLQGGGVEVHASSINNAANAEISSAGITHLVADGALVNRGLLDGVVNHLQAGQLDNVGSGRIYGDHVAIEAGSLNNRAEVLNGITAAATIAARERLDLGVQGVLSNSGQSLIFSDGNAAIGGALDANRLATGAAQKIDNLGSTIEVSGNLDIAALAVNNIRENVIVTQESSSSTAQLNQPSWWNNGSNNTNNIRNSSNYQAHEIYYLSPDDILEDTPHITPDGYVVHKAVIKVNARTTAYFFGSGALYGAKGERSRIDLADGTMTIYYTGRQDNQSNPDQVSNGADDPFAELTVLGPGAPAFSYVSDNLTYSNAYGTCTTNCVQLTAWHAYTDPDSILIYPNRYSSQNLSGNERYRLATHSIVQDVVQSAGPDAIIHAGGNMRIDTDALTNKYARIAAGGNLAIVGLNKAESSVENIALELYRTHSFKNVSVTFGGARHNWTNPDISEKTGQLGGQITAGGTLTVDVGDLSNLNDGRNPPNVQDGLEFGSVNTGGPAGGNLGPGAGQVQGPGASNGQSAGVAVGNGPKTVADSGDGGGVGTGRLQDVLGKIAAKVASDAPDAAQQGGQGGANIGGGASAVTGATAVKANGDDPALILAGTLDNTAPSASLFKVDANRGQHLVETDPRFADYRNWLSSDYLLTQMGFDPVHMQKRLGDGFYEQKLVREQIGELTGRRFLDGYASDEDQYRALLEAGATVASKWGLRPGIALTAEQMAQLTSDIVWLVEQTITLADGSTTTALVPQVFLRVQPGDLNDNGALLAGANVDLKLRGDFVNQGDVAGRKLVSIDAGNIRNLAGANINGEQVGLQARQDIDIIGSKVTATDALSVKAGGNVTVASTTRSWENGGSHAQSSTSIDRVAGLYVTSPSGIGALKVNAGGDVTLTGAQVINAGVSGATVLAAGGNLNLETIAQKQSLDLTTDSRNYVRNSQTTHVGSTVSGAGNVVLQAGNDVNLAAANVNAGNAIAMQAGRDINSSVAVDVSTVDTSYAGKKASGAVSASDETVRGTQITAGGDIALQAGRDVTLQATSVASDEGGIGVSAGRDVNLTAAQEQHDLTIDEQRKKKGFLKSKTTTTHDEWHDSIAVTSTLSGETVTVAAGRDLTSQGAQIAGTGDVLLAAGRDVVLDVAQNSHTEVHDKTVTKSGLFSGGGVGFTIGKQRTDTTADIEEKTRTGSLIGSTDGRVDIAAGRDVTITGSDVLSRDGIGIIGQNVTIQAAEDSTSVTETQKFKQTGINVSLKGGAVDTALAVKNSVERASEAKDDRLSALHAAKAGQTLFSSGGAGLSSLKGMGDQIGQAKADVANEKQTAGGLSLRVGIGASKSSSSTEYTATTSSGSRIASEGDVVIQATGDGQGNGGDLKIIGSKVEGDNVALAAANDLILKSQQETRQQIERNKSSSGEIGITIGSEAGFGVYVAASAAKGKGDGSGTTHAETTIDAANTLTMISGRDMTLEGAQAKGNTVIANVGRDLTMISQQDSNDYKRKDVSAGIDVAVGTGGASVSANYNQSKIDSTYTSVKEQTGIQAGEGGFDINVGGHTQLTGAAIASTADPSRNHLSTGSLSVEDLKNEAAYKASSVGISVSGSTSGGMNAPAPSVGIPQSEKASSVTRGDIAAGTVEVRNGDTTALDGLSRDTNALQQDGLKEIFDQQKVQERLEMGQVAGEVGFTAANDLISWRQDVAAEELRAARAEAGAAAESNDPEAISAAKQRLQIAQAEYGKWDEGGAMKRGTQVATGMLVAVVGGGDIGAAAMGVMANEVLLGKVSSFLNQKGIDSGTAGHDLAIALTGVAGSTVGGAIIGDAMSGVSAGTTAHNYGYYGYRDGGIKAERELNGILDEFAAANPDVSAEDLDGLKATLMGTLKLGATTGDLLAIASTPGYLAEMTVASAVQALAIARFGIDFDALDEQQRRSVAEDFMRFGQVGVMENLSHDGNSAPIEQVDQEPAGREPDWQTKVGTAFSDLIVSGQRGTEKAVNWLGEDNATAAAMAVMVALGGPVKTGLGMAFSASPAGQAIEGVKEQVKDWLTPINGTYLFGANTAAAQNTVLPASGAVAGTTVELGSSLLGASMAASIKGIIGISKGFGSKVDAADSARNEPRDVLGGPHSETTRPSGDGLDSHHCPAKACYADAPLSSEKGPAIKMDPADHRRTTSYGSGDDAIAYRAAQRKLLEQGRLREAIQMDIDDIRMKFGGKYNDGIKQMLEYAETLDSKDFIPKAGGK
uniref:hemagglutinin repeat-containing protein n=1 Tax=Stenotrophomonas pigmentata TaxID=3055080 RepID=UPI003870131C